MLQFNGTFDKTISKHIRTCLTSLTYYCVFKLIWEMIKLEFKMLVSFCSKCLYKISQDLVIEPKFLLTAYFFTPLSRNITVQYQSEATIRVLTRIMFNAISFQHLISTIRSQAWKIHVLFHKRTNCNEFLICHSIKYMSI